MLKEVDTLFVICVIKPFLFFLAVVFALGAQASVEQLVLVIGCVMIRAISERNQHQVRQRVAEASSDYHGVGLHEHFKGELIN